MFWRSFSIKAVQRQKLILYIYFTDTVNKLLSVQEVLNGSRLLGHTVCKAFRLTQYEQIFRPNVHFWPRLVHRAKYVQIMGSQKKYAVKTKRNSCRMSKKSCPFSYIIQIYWNVALDLIKVKAMGLKYILIQFPFHDSVCRILKKLNDVDIVCKFMLSCCQQGN